MYLFMITLGLNIDDIVTFMTSDVANFIDAITETDIFNNYGISLDDAYKIASGDFSSLIDSDIIELLQYDYPKIEDLGKLIRSGNIPAEIDLSKYSDSPNIVDAINNIREIKALMNFNPNIKETKQDIAEFKNIMNGANEFSNYARVLGANQGIKTSKGELQNHIQFLQSLTTNAAKAKGIKASKVPVEFQNFDLIAFVDNKEYAPGKFYKDELIKYYNGIKQGINIFDHIDKIAQFNAIFKIESAILQYDQNLSVKTKIYDQIYSILKNIGNTYISENYLTKLVRSIDNNLVVGFFQNEDIQIPIIKGFPVYDKYGRENPANESQLLKLDSLEALATFKRWMESTVIPELKNGNYYNYGLSMTPEALINSFSQAPLKTAANSSVHKIHEKGLASNKFIKGLTKTISNGVPLYKCDLNMLTVENTPFNQVILSQYVAGLEALQNIKVTENLSLADMFILYNLIINKNNYGAERMTSVLDGLVKSNNSLSFINKFLEFEGNIDYYGEVSREPDSNIITVTASIPGKQNILFEINYIDNLATTASTVTTLKGQKDPSVVLLEADGSKTFYVRQNGSYIAKNIYPDLGDTGQERINRNNNLKKDYVLGGYLKSKIDMTLKNFSTLDETTLETIKQLMQEQILNIGEHCD